jgi:hypothetical protein
MPSWKKVVVSGSDATLNSVSGSSFVYSGGDVIAAQNLRSIYSSGDEGGEIFLNKPATNTSITTGVNIDIYQNKLRIWETGGTNRGFYLDMTTGGTGVGTNLASGGGTVTSVSASGTVSGITLGGGPITGAGTLTLSGTISGLTTSNLSATAAITNAQLANSSVTVGSTAINLGSSATTIAGLSSVTSTSFVGALTGNATTATQTTNTVGAGSDADIVYSNMAGNDQFRIRTGGASNAGYVEIATADDGTEPIYVRQYTGVFTSLARTATLLDGSGNTTFPGSVTANSFSGPLSGNATSATTAATASSVITAGSVTGGSHYFLIYTTSPNGGDAGAVRTSNLIYNSATNTLPTTSSWATNVVGGTGVTSVGGTGTVNGISLSGTVTSSGSLTLGGTLSGIGNAQLTNSTITIAGTSTALGSSISQATILASSGVFSGSAQVNGASITNNGVIIGSTSITLGSSATTIAGLSSVTSTTFVGALTGNASTATSAATWTTGRTITIGSTGKTVDGSGNVSWTLGEIGAQAALTNPVTGTGTTNYIPKFTGTSAIGNSVIYDDGTNVGIGTTSPNSKLHVVGNTSITGSTNITGSLVVSDSHGISLDTSNFGLSAYGSSKVEWGVNILRDNNGQSVLDWGAFELYSQDPATSLNWNNRYLYDSASAISVDWNGRRLSNHYGNTLLTWEGNSATLTGTSSWATNVVNNGVTSVATAGSVNGITLTGGTITGTGTITLGGTLSGIGNAQLTNSSVTVGSTAISLGSSATTIAGLHTVTATNFTGTASVASTVNTVRTNAGDTYYPTFVDSSNGGAGAPEQLYTAVAGAGALQYSAAAGLLTATGFAGSLTGNVAGTASWATNVVNNGVTSVGGTGTVNGISLSGTVTSTGNLTLGGTLSGIGNAQLTNSSITVGSTAISLGSSATTITGLSSVTSTNFVGTSSYSLKSDTSFIKDETVSATTWYPTFVTATDGYRQLTVDSSALTYNPSTNTLTTTASLATRANTVQTVTTALDGVHYLTFVRDDNAVAGQYESLTTDPGVTYNPSSNILTAGTFSGNATTATTAASASTILPASGPAGTYSIPWMSQISAGVATYVQGNATLTYATSTGQLNATTFNGAVTSTDLRVNGFSQKTGSIHILQTSNVSGSGVRLRQQGTANYWDMYVTASTGTLTNGLQFRYNGGNNGGYLDALTNAANIDFTGQHRSLSNTINITGSTDLTGLIVVADGTYTNLNNNHLPQINEALPNVSLSTTINDKRVFGVISDKEEKGRREYAVGAWVSTFDTSGSEAPRLIINSLGEGGMWVCNANGSLENGDYITTSNLPGFGMKQADDILHNYTVAKITEDCLFDSMRTIDFDFSGSAYKKQFVGVTYHCG